MKFNDALDKYLSEVLITKSKNYQRNAKQQLRYWGSKFPNKSLARVSPSMIRDNLPNHVSSVTKNRYLESLSAFFNTCVIDWYLVKENPVSKVRKFPEPRGRVRYLSDDERTRLLEACRTSKHKYLYCIVVIALSTGMRRTEVTTLTWDQINLDRKTIYLHTTKNKERRVIPLVGLAYELVSNLPIKGNKLFPGKSIRGAFPKALKDAGIENYTFHDNRHDFCSQAVMNGVSLYDVATIVGHRSLRSTQRYAHLSTDHTRKILEGLEDKIFPK